MELNDIYYGDAYELIKQIDDKSIDLIITDTPYEFGVGDICKTLNNGATFTDDIMANNINKGIDLSILDEFVRVMKKINIYIWCNKTQIYDYLTYFVKQKKCNFEFIIYAKNNPVPLAGHHLIKDKEYCLYFWETGVKIDGKYDELKTVYYQCINQKDKKQYLHPTIKPLNIIENLVKISSREGEIIFDPFVGSGTTCVAAKRLGRKYIGFEINEKYYKIAKDRLQGWNQKGEMSLFDI